MSFFDYLHKFSVIVNGKLPDHTICPAANHYNTTHYNLHNLYGHSEAVASHNVLNKLLDKRSIVVSRSSYVSTGHYAAHWTGDNVSDWPNMAYSIPAILSFQLFGIPFTGADICGFGGTTTPELCTRWMQLGSFYPFMRNHNSLKSPDQDPAIFDEATQEIMKEAMFIRYSLLPYLYTLLYRSHVNGTAVVRPLFFSYPNNVTYGLDTQFLWGDSLMISPVLTEGATVVDAYLPKELWYDLYSSEAIQGRGEYVVLPAPIDKINVHIRGGSILATFVPEVTTVIMRKRPFDLIVSLSSSGDATGELFWDDGEMLDVVEKGQYNLLKFQASGFNTITTSVQVSGYNTTMVLGYVWVSGMRSEPSIVEVNGKSVPFEYIANIKRLFIGDIAVSLLQSNEITWS